MSDEQEQPKKLLNWIDSPWSHRERWAYRKNEQIVGSTSSKRMGGGPPYLAEFPLGIRLGEFIHQDSAEAAVEKAYRESSAEKVKDDQPPSPKNEETEYEIEVPRRVVSVERKCGSVDPHNMEQGICPGRMISTGQAFMGNPPSYVHACTSCNRRQAFKKVYPVTEYRRT
jgi:hypothetical protein